MDPSKLCKTCQEHELEIEKKIAGELVETYKSEWLNLVTQLEYLKFENLRLGEENKSLKEVKIVNPEENLKKKQDAKEKLKLDLLEKEAQLKRKISEQISDISQKIKSVQKVKTVQRFKIIYKTAKKILPIP